MVKVLVRGEVDLEEELEAYREKYDAPPHQDEQLAEEEEKKEQEHTKSEGVLALCQTPCFIDRKVLQYYYIVQV